MFELIRKTLRDKRFFILGWSLGLIFMGYLMTLFFPSFSGGEIDQMMDSLPPAMQGFVGNMQDWRQLPGYIGSQLFDIRLPIIVSILVILLASSLSVGEEQKGYLRTLVSLPISRRRIVLAKWVSIVIISLIASLAVILGVELAVLQIGESLDQTVLLRLGLVTWLMVSALATLIFALGMATGSRAMTTGVGTVVTIGSFIVSTFSQAVDWLASYDWLSLFHYFPATDIAKGTIDAQNLIVYGAIIVLSLAIALVAFPLRDVKDA